MQVEIIGTDGKVHYRRPHDHPDVLEAFKTPGYSVRGASESVASDSRPAPGSATWIRFHELTPNPATKRWAVMPKDGPARIGIVSWYGPWRKYCFFPTPDTVYEQVCLREIADFCEGQTVLHRLDKQHKPRIDALRASEKITEDDMKLIVR